VRGAALFRDGSIDALFIDGDHSRPGAYADTAAWMHKVDRLTAMSTGLGLHTKVYQGVGNVAPVGIAGRILGHDGVPSWLTRCGKPGEPSCKDHVLHIMQDPSTAPDGQEQLSVMSAIAQACSIQQTCVGTTTHAPIGGEAFSDMSVGPLDAALTRHGMAPRDFVLAFKGQPWLPVDSTQQGLNSTPRWNTVLNGLYSRSDGNFITEIDFPLSRLQGCRRGRDVRLRSSRHAVLGPYRDLAAALVTAGVESGSHGCTCSLTSSEQVLSSFVGAVAAAFADSDLQGVRPGLGLGGVSRLLAQDLVTEFGRFVARKSTSVSPPSDRWVDAMPSQLRSIAMAAARSCCQAPVEYERASGLKVKGDGDDSIVVPMHRGGSTALGAPVLPVAEQLVSHVPDCELVDEGGSEESWFVPRTSQASFGSSEHVPMLQKLRYSLQDSREHLLWSRGDTPARVWKQACSGARAGADAESTRGSILRFLCDQIDTSGWHVVGLEAHGADVPFTETLLASS